MRVTYSKPQQNFFDEWDVYSFAEGVLINVFTFKTKRQAEAFIKRNTHN